ncbi:SDR family oxidoreductase [Zooshikella ganghwensis]|uniref:SDR family NAD(P)-dependent oxidoreductase n=1 Tax=Zooshikella ganghwensis TaxID=202772 RepID=A0A4P9VPK2_9GAMM|nr:SDR family oxidoreductase [Zooshikella ganghwensis]RDH45393.1 SDR family NAD(P)-dependent oxidoreductase [Zooshikella ganghwensis]
MELKNRSIMITGGAQGLGKAMALHLASQGANLALVDLNADLLSQTADECESRGVKVTMHTANVASETEVIETVNTIAHQHGTIDGLINNAGILRDGMLVKVKNGEIVKKLSLEQWQSVIDVNLTGVFLCGREVAAHMIEHQTAGVIINISSIARSGNIGQTNYAATKAGVIALTTTWAKELARYNIRCGAIAPGFIATDMTASMKQEALERMTKAIPLQRMGTPDQIAQAAEFIFTNDYFSGRVIEVDGAMRL